MRFTVRRPPVGEVSPCCHRPPGGDVSCSVHVGVAPARIAGLTLEDRLALAVFRRDVPARGATLRRVCRYDLLDPAESLMTQSRGEKSPTAPTDRAIQPALLRNSRAGVLRSSSRTLSHRSHVQGFDPDRVEPAREIGGGFLNPIFATARLAGLEFRDREFRCCATIRTTLTTHEPLLQHLQPLYLTRCKSRDAQHFAGRQRGRHCYATVDTNDAAVIRSADRIGHVRERDMPTAGPIASDAVRLDTVWQWTRQAKSYIPNLRDPDPSGSTVQLLDMVRPQSNLSKPFMHAGLAPTRATVCAREEVVHRLRKVSQRLLLHRLTTSAKPPVFSAGLGQLRSLLQVAGGLAPSLPIPLLFDRQIPHVTGVAAMRYQAVLLLTGRKQSIPRHNRTVTATTDTADRCEPAHPDVGRISAMKSRIFNLLRRLR